jgi:hypothetical protein
MKIQGFEYKSAVLPRAKLTRMIIGEPYRYRKEFGITETIRQFNDVRDPNTDYVNSLDEAGRSAFREALTGGEGKKPGCLTYAINSAEGVAPNKPVASAVNRFDLDQRVQDYRLEWRTCMAKSGYKDVTRTALVNRLLDEYGAKHSTGISIEELSTLEEAVVADDRSCVSNEVEQEFQSLGSSFLREGPLQQLPQSVSR